MTGHGLRRWMGAGMLAASVPLIGSVALAETKPPIAPQPKGCKWELSEFDAVKGRTAAKGKSSCLLPEKDDQVLVRGRRKAQ